MFFFRVNISHREKKQSFRWFGILDGINSLHNPLTPKSDQFLISPYNISLDSNIKVARIQDHQVEKLLIVKHILLISTFKKCIKNSMENMHTDVRVERVKGECNLFFASVGKRINLTLHKEMNLKLCILYCNVLALS